MKKNKMMRLASFLLIAVLVSTSAISGTYAKYVSSATADDTARVAKWGVTVTATGSLFSEDYVAVGDGNVPGAANLTVEGSGKVVAPGTKSPETPVKGVQFEIAGIPEVKVDITVDATLTLGGWKQIADWDGDPATAADEQEYCPLIFTVGTMKYHIAADDGDDTTVECSDVADLQTKVVTAVKAELEKTVAAGNNLADSMNFSWEWPFETSDANNKKDTALGNLAAAGTAPTVAFAMTVTVTQVD